jgi:hypothetical protein
VRYPFRIKIPGKCIALKYRSHKTQTLTQKTGRAQTNTNLLVHDHTHGALGHVPHNPGATVVELVRHALVDGAVHLDVDILPDLEVAQVGRQGDVPLMPEGAREQVSRPGAQSMAGRHVGEVSSLGPERRRARWRWSLGETKRESQLLRTNSKGNSALPVLAWRAPSDLRSEGGNLA